MQDPQISMCGGGASGSLICFLLGVPSAKWTEIDEGELKNACFQSRKILVLNFMFIFSSLRVSFLLLDWQMIIGKESTKYFIRQTPHPPSLILHPPRVPQQNAYVS